MPLPQPDSEATPPRSAGAERLPVVTDQVQIRFASRLELARMAALPRLASGPEPLSIGRGWLLQMVRARGARGGREVAPAAG